jgi:F-type H+-transporting ATPase subunit delta
VIPSAILGRYAKSLAEVVLEENIEQKVTADLAVYREIFHVVPDILDVFHSPAVPRESKEKLMDALMAQYPVSPVTSNFLRILLQHNRIRFYDQITDGYLKAVNESRGILSARVTAATKLSPEELKKVADQLSSTTGKLVHVELQTDPDLLGGIVVQMGSTVIDGSIRTQLADMKKRLAGSNV